MLEHACLTPEFLNKLIRDPARLTAVRRTALLDTPAEEYFDRLSHLACKGLHCHLALISLLDDDRLFFKSCVGQDSFNIRREMPLAKFFCHYSVALGDILIIEDASRHELVKDHPAVQAFDIKGYLSTPFFSAEGHGLGAVCVIDTQPRVWSQQEIKFLRSIAQSVAGEIELRATLHEGSLHGLNYPQRMANFSARETHLPLFMEQMPALLWTTDTQLRITSWLGTSPIGFNIPANQLIGTSLCEIFETDNPYFLPIAKHLKVLRGNGPVAYELDWAQRIFQCHLEALRDANCNIIGTAGIAIDITARKHAEQALQESEALFRASFEQATMGMAHVGMDGKWLHVNQKLCEIVGYTQEEMLRRGFQDLTHPDDLSVNLEQFESLKAGKIASYSLEKRYCHKDGSIVWVYLTVSLVCEVSGKRQYLICIIEDITDNKRSQQALCESEQRYALAVQGANDGLWDWNIDTNEVYYSERWKSLLGYRDNEIGTSPDEYLKRIHPLDVERVRADIDSHFAGLTPYFECEHRMLHKDGGYRWMLNRGLAIRNAEGNASRMAGSQTDVTERKAATDRLAEQAFYDTLTGLPNRALLNDRLLQMIERAKRYKKFVFGVLFLDLDRFKVINDSLGHLFGDQLLISISQRLKSCLRPEDTLARLGGDEFIILLDDIKGIRDALHATHRIHQCLKAPVHLNGCEIHTSASIGIALSTVGYDKPQDILRDADMAMYRAKALGRARHALFSHDMRVHSEGLWALESELRRAIERQEFLIHYQPIIALTSGRILGAEALVRWEHPQRGLILPEDFIALAEETGLITALSEWLLRSVCAQTKSWNDNGHPLLRVAINCSPRQFQDRHLPDLLKVVLDETSMDADNLDLEITETLAMKDLDYTLDILNELSALGIKISMDDFGTGYSSLGYLNRFPIDTVKIDKSFIKDLTSPETGAIPGAIIAMAHSLKLKVIAEGVETEQQMLMLREQHCDAMQGYLFSKPMPAEEFTALLCNYHYPARALFSNPTGGH